MNWWDDDEEFILPNRVINTIEGGNNNMYTIAFVVSGARSPEDFMQVALQHQRTANYLKQLQQKPNE